MKVTLFIGGLSGGGAERVTCNLANFLEVRGHDVEVLTVSDEPSAYFLNKKIKRCSLTGGFLTKTPLRNVIRIIRLAYYLITRKRDVFVVMLPQTTFMLLKLKHLTSAKIIAAQRIMPSSLKQENQIKLKLYADKADGWTFQTEEQQLWFDDALRKAKKIVIPNAINPDFIQDNYIVERRKEIVTAGRMTSQKNQKMLIEAFEEVHKRYSDYKLIIYGEGPEKNNLESLVKKHNLIDFVVFPGYTINVGEKIMGSSLFVLSSDYEGMPNALMEAMALGVPCVSTDCKGGGAKFLINNEENGILTPIGDTDALTNAIEKMLSDRDFAEKCGRNAHKICERLAPEKIYGEWEKFIQEVVDSK